MEDKIAFELDGFSFGQAAGANDIRDHLDFRARIFNAEYAERLSESSALQEEMTENEYDRQAVFFNARKEGAMVGTLRCVEDGPLGFPIEETAGISCDYFRERGKVVEAGRFAIEPQLRFSAPSVFMGLTRAVHLYSLYNNVYFVLTDVPQHLRKVYGRIGFKPFAPPREHYIKEMFYPSFMNVAELTYRKGQNLSEGMRSYYRGALMDKEGRWLRARKLLYCVRIGINERIRGKKILAISEDLANHYAKEQR